MQYKDLLDSLMRFGGAPDPLEPVSMAGMPSAVPNGSTIAATRLADPNVTGTNPMSMMDRLFGTADGRSDGFLLPGISALTGLGNAYMGMKQFGLAEDSLDFQKDAFSKNFEAQKRTTNAQLADRQRARLAANPNGGYQSEAEYMSKFGVQ